MRFQTAIRTVLLAALGLALFALPGLAAAGDYPGNLRDMDYSSVIAVSGSVTVQRGGSAFSVKPGDMLEAGDVLRTGTGGKAVIGYLTDSRLLVWSDSELHLEFLGRVDTKEKGFDYTLARGRVFNKVGGSYFGSTAGYALVPGGSIAFGDAEFGTIVDGQGVSIGVRRGSVKVTGTGWTKTVGEKQQFLIQPTGAAGFSGALSDTYDQQLRLAAQDMIAAGYGGGSLQDSTSYYPRTIPKYKTSSKLDDSPASEVPYYRPERWGTARTENKDYRSDLYRAPRTNAALPPGDTLDSDIWAELYAGTDDYLNRPDANYPYPDSMAVPPQKVRTGSGETLRTVPPPSLEVMTPRPKTDGLMVGDYSAAYKLCQDYASTQSQIDDCIIKHLKPEARPDALKFPETPPELNLPMSHEPQTPAYVTLPPVSELPPPTLTGGSVSSPLYCSFSLFRNTHLMHNDTGADLLNQGRYAAALDTFEDALRVNPNHPEILNNIAATYYRMGDARSAERFLNLALTQEQDNTTIHNTLGCVLLEQGKTAPACAEWEFVLKIQPQQSQASRNRYAFCDIAIK